MIRFAAALVATTLGLAATTAEALPLRITITNTQGAGGVHATPLWVGFSDGGFDAFDVGAPASPGVERVAELGFTDVVGQELADAPGVGVGATIAAPGGFPGAPIIEPGESASIILDVDPAARFFQYLSMVLPSNDTFFGNDDPLEIFDAAGGYLGDRTFQIVGAFDAGTEANDFTDGPAFVPGQAATAGTVTDGTIAATTDIGLPMGGVGLPTGATTDVAAFAAFLAGDVPFGTVEITRVPLPPAGLAMLALVAAGAVASRRRTAA